MTPSNTIAPTSIQSVRTPSLPNRVLTPMSLSQRSSTMSKEEFFQHYKGLFEAVTVFLTKFKGNFNIRENMPVLILDFAEGTGNTNPDTLLGVKEFCIAAYTGTMFLSMFYPYGGKEKLKLKTGEPCFFDKLLLSVFCMHTDFESVVVEHKDVAEACLAAFRKIKVYIVKKKALVKNVHYLKQLWEKHAILHIQAACYGVVRILIFQLH